MDQGKISIIVPVRDAGSTIEDCIASLCAQTYRDMEILVVWLGNGEGTRCALEKLSDPRIRLIEQTERTGSGGARNLGIEQAGGEWIGFAESDDIVEAGYYEELMRHAEEGVDIVWGGIMLRGKKWVEHSAVTRLDTFEKKYARIKNGATFDKLFRADLIRGSHIRFAEGIHWEDNLFLFQAFYYAREVVTVPGVYYTYRPSPWSAEHRAALQHDVAPAAEGIVSWARGLALSGKQRSLIDRKIMESFAGAFLADEGIYRQMVQLMGHHGFLLRTFLRYKWKKLKHRLFHKKGN